MKPVHTFVVTAHLPDNLLKLKEIAYNYWWCWDGDAKEIFPRINKELWGEVNHNPVMLINKISKDRQDELSNDHDFVAYLDYIYDKFQKYMTSESWYDKNKKEDNSVIAYFSPEYGINESFPNYSGGLGILSGDHLKSASDLGIPLVAIGLLYQQGYFRQHLTQHGWQNELYTYNDFFSMPVNMVKDKNGEPLIVDVDLPLGKCFAKVWQVNVGKVRLFLLDTNIDENGIDEYKDITDQLYGGTRDTRMQQEILLGIGGMRALKAMGIMPDVIHINEGHAAFALLERSRMYMEQYGIDFWTAAEITKTSSIFTTHTPVPAGNEVFKVDKMDKYFNAYLPKLGLNRQEFIQFGQIESNANEDFSMTVLGLRMTSHHNGVSKLHGEVSRNMWHALWKCFPAEEVPIKHITNGIHTQTWVAREMAELYDRYLGQAWRTDTDNNAVWEKVEEIPAEELWREKQRRRVRLVLFCREHLKRKQKGFLLPDQVSKINEYLDPDALTIGFARRFATYKRATLIFRDMNRLKAILTDPEHPVQIILAGKAHPHDTQGKESIQAIVQRVREHGLEKHVVFLEDYDMIIARMMLKGCDVWLNNPIKPQEASGTSGMKAALNAGLNFSILDGWWDEAYNGQNGFAIGEGEEYQNHEEQEIIESELMYTMLEKVIVKSYYDRSGSRVPEKWISFMKNSVKTIAGQFSTHRMLKDYANMYYIPALSNFKRISENNAEAAKTLKLWKDKVRNNWSSIDIVDVTINRNGEMYVGKEVPVGAVIALGDLSPDDISVQVYHGSVDPHGELIQTQFDNLYLKKSDGGYHYYEGAYLCPDTGIQGITIRVLPQNEMLTGSAELYLCSWA